MKKGCFFSILLVLAVAVTVILWGKQISQRALQLLYPRSYAEIVSQKAAAFSLDENLVYAVIRAESKFDEDAQSSAGAQGLMQLTPETFEWILTKYPAESELPDIFAPADNIHAGCALLRLLVDQFGSLNVALSAYNAGMGNVAKWLENEDYSSDGTNLHTIPFPETEAYVKKVFENLSMYQKLYGEKSPTAES